MKRSRFSDKHTIAIVKEQEAGVKTADVCRKHGISDTTFYKSRPSMATWRISKGRRLKALVDENARLKRLLADAMLDDDALKEIEEKTGGARCEAVGGPSHPRAARSQRAPCLRHRRRGASGRPVRSGGARRPRPAPALAGVGREAPSVRVQATRLPHCPGGPGVQSQATAADLSRGGPEGPPAWRS